MYDATPLSNLLAQRYLSLIHETEDFLAFEEDAYSMGYKIIADAISKAIELFDDELYQQRPSDWKVKERVWRSPVSEVGQLSFRRRVYVDEVGERRSLVDEILDLPKSAHITPGAFDKLTSFGVETSYHATARLSNRHIEAGITPETAMNALRKSASLLKKETQAKAKEIFNDGVIPNGKTERDAISVEADGVWVPLQIKGRKKAEPAPRAFEIKAMVAYSGKVTGRKGTLVRREPIAFDAVASPDSFWKQSVSVIAGQFDLGKIRKCHLGADGERWCGRLGEYIPHVEVDFKLDQFHVNQVITKGLGDKRDQAEAFRLLYHSGVDELLSFLRKIETEEDGNKSLGQAISYIKSHRGDIDPHGRSLGTMESTHAHIIGSRMKAVGGAWSKDGGDAMARARAHVANGGKMPRPHYPVQLKKKGKRAALRQRKEYRENPTYFVDVIGEGEQDRVYSLHMPAPYREQLSTLATATPLAAPIVYKMSEKALKPVRHYNQKFSYTDDGRFLIRPKERRGWKPASEW